MSSGETVAYPYLYPYSLLASVTPILWRHKPDGQGHCPIWLRFGDSGRTLYASLGVRLHPRFWNGAAKRVRKTHPLHQDINELIEARLAEIEKRRLHLLSKRAPVTAEGLKLALNGPAETTCLLTFARDYLVDVDAQGNVQRARKERAVLDKLEEFAGAPLPFRRIDASLLERWTSWLMTKRGNRASTVGSAITVVRIHYNRAVRHGIVSLADSPFPSYRRPRITSTDRTKLTASQVAALAALDLGPRGPGASGLSRVRDWFLFSLYAQGMRFSDVVQLRRRNVARDEDDARAGVTYRVRYRMGKTGKLNAVLLLPPALAILEPYLAASGEPDDYLFDALARYDTTTPGGLLGALSSRNAYANKLLVELAKRAGISERVSFHTARHSFADLARKNGWSVYDVSRALQHSGLDITARYLATLDVEALDDRMRGLFSPSDL